MPRGKKLAKPTYAEMPEIAAILTDRIEQVRVALGLTVAQMATTGRLSGSTVAEFRRGETTDPRLSTVLKVCTGLGVAPEEILAGLPTPPPRRRSNSNPTSDRA